MIKYDIPFYPNPDETHCVQAVFRMVLKYFTWKEYSWEELDRMSHKVKDKGTWLFPALIEFAKLGIEIENVESFNYQKFYEEGEPYVRKYYRPVVANWYTKGSNLLDVKGFIPEYLKTVKNTIGSATIDDIEKYLTDGWLVACDVNAGVLVGEKGYDSHLVLVVGFDRGNLYLNDPYLPEESYKDRKVSKRLFQKAWSSAGEGTEGLTAFRKG